jgi:drug/metabolite transporter (DMT)-like permease
VRHEAAVTATAPATVAHRDHRLGLAAMGVAVTAWGLTGVILKAIEMDAIAIAFWRFTIYAALFSVFVRWRGGRVDRRVMRLAMPGGLCLAADVMLFFTAVKLTNIVNATTIGALQPLILAAVAARWFGETIRPRDILAALVAIAGVVVIVVESAGTPTWRPAGDLAAVGALAGWSGYWVFAKRAQGTLTPMEYTAATGWWTALLALPIGFVFGHDMSVPDDTTWLPLAGLIIVGGVLGHSLTNWAIVRVPLWLGSTLTLLIPVLSSIAAWLFLDEGLTPLQLAAMAVVVAALATVVATQSNPQPESSLADPT